MRLAGCLVSDGMGGGGEQSALEFGGSNMHHKSKLRSVQHFHPQWSPLRRVHEGERVRVRQAPHY